MMKKKDAERKPSGYGGGAARRAVAVVIGIGALIQALETIVGLVDRFTG